MKKTISMVAGVVLSLLSVSVKAQQPTQPQTPPQQAEKPWDAHKNPTIDSILSPYESKMLSQRPAMTTADIFPVIGQYQSSSSTDASALKINLDEQNRGIVWIEGLPQGRVKAYLRRSPSTYMIPAQKTEDGKQIAEGVLLYDKDANTLNVCLGCAYNADDPGLAFNTNGAVVTDESAPAVKTVTKTKKNGVKSKTKAVAKAKPWYYSGTKVIETTASTSNQ
jgi:hypothetical protein